MLETTNWAGNYTYRAQELHRPTTAAAIQRIVARATAAGTGIRALGSRHSFNGIADSRAELISLEGLDPVVEIDGENITARFAGGARYGMVAAQLHRHGYALHNLASLPHISVAGAVATATHGSGDGNRGLASGVAAMDIVTATGDILTVARDATPDFAGMVVGLGALGVVTSITVDIEEAFEVRQTAYQNLPWQNLLENFDAITASGYSVSIFTDWRGDTARQVWVKELVDLGDQAERREQQRDDFFGATRASEALHMLPGISAENCTIQLGVAGPWYDRLPHFKLEFTPSNGAELQSEYLIPRAHAVAAIQTLKNISEQISPLLHGAEVRTVAADDLWLSMAYRQDVVGIHFTWRPDQAAVEAVLPAVEAALAPFDARPHWGKVFISGASEIERLYPRLGDFRALAERLDPRGTFRNDFLRHYVFAGEGR